MPITADDHRYMARALELARNGLYTADPNPRVGCVLVADNGEIVGEGYHARAGEPHAEVNALRVAGDAARGATAYITLEPCCHEGRTPPCTGALLAAGIARVVYAIDDPNPLVAGQGREQLQRAGIEVESGVLANEASELNVGFIARMQRGRPWVRVKIAVSLDGRTGLANGESKWITSEAARADVHRWRARSSAIMTGVGTVHADNPAFSARIPGLAAGEIVQPACVIVDSQLGIVLDTPLFATGNTVIVAHCTGAGVQVEALEAAGAIVMQFEQNPAGRVSLEALLAQLAELEYNEIMVEAGQRLNGALLAAGLVDELIVYQAPSVLGSDGLGMFATPPIFDMRQRYNFDLTDVRRFGPDLRLRYSVRGLHG